jgi:putative oxidoreductase
MFCWVSVILKTDTMTFFQDIFTWLFAERGYDAGLLLLRLTAGLFMLPHAWVKIQNYSALAENFTDPFGWGPKWSLNLIILTETGCSILLILGALTRLAVIPSIVGMVVAAFFARPKFVLAKSEPALLFLCIYIVLLVTGAGRFSVDHLLGRWLAG